MDIHHALFWGCVAVCAVAELLILRDVFAPATDVEAPAHLPRSPKAIEILWGVLPIFALVALFWDAWRALA